MIRGRLAASKMNGANRKTDLHAAVCHLRKTYFLPDFVAFVPLGLDLLSQSAGIF